MTDPETLPLAADFPPASREEWRTLVDAVLKGAPFERLVSTTYDGLTIEPLAQRRSDARPVAARPGARAWEVTARIEHPDPALANEIALRELNNGAGGLSLVFSGAAGDYGFGLPASEAALGRTLEGFDFGAGAGLEFDLSPHAAAVVDTALAKGAMRSGRGAGIRVGHDPIGASAIGDGTMRPWNDEAPHFARRIAALLREGFLGRLAAADGRVIHNAGGSESAGTDLRAQRRARLSAHARSGRRHSRGGAACDLLSPLRRRRSVSHHRQIPRVAEIMGPRRSLVRT